MRCYIRFVFVFFLLLQVACKPNTEPPYVYETDPLFTTGRVTYYGAYYSGVDNHVLSLELYTEGMLGENGEAEFPGQCLYFEDVFIPVTEKDLVPSKYLCSDSIGEFIFISGEKRKIDNLEATFGARIRYIEESERRNTTKLITAGSFEVFDDGSILFDLETADGMALKGRFEGKMEYIDGYYNPKDSLEKVNILRIRNKIRQAK